MRERGIVLDPHLDHGTIVRICAEVGVRVEELDSSSAGPAQVSFLPVVPTSAMLQDIIWI